MEGLFRKKFYFYKILNYCELKALFDNNFELSVDFCVDDKIFTTEEDAMKQAKEYANLENYSKMFYAEFETDEIYYKTICEKCDNNCFLISKDSLSDLNLHLFQKSGHPKIFISQLILIDGFLQSIPLNIVNELLDYGVVFDEKYYQYIYSYKSPFKCDGSNLFIADACNRRYREKLGRIVVYKENPVFYDDVLSAVMDNEKKYKFGFEKLHNVGIFPVKHGSRLVSKFGIDIKEPTKDDENPYITYLNMDISDLYRWKNGVRAHKCYNDSYFRDQDDGQTFEEFKIKQVKYRCFIALLQMRDYLKMEDINCENIDKEIIPNDDENKWYYNSIKSLLQRYTYNNKSVFQRVNNLNHYKDISGIYILCFDREHKIYIGQTKKCLKERIVQHFCKPQSNFDKTHSFEDVTEIFILRVENEFLNYVEMDCIASISPELLFNKFAGGNSVELITNKKYISENRPKYLLNHKAISSISCEAEKLNSITKKE